MILDRSGKHSGNYAPKGVCPGFVTAFLSVNQMARIVIVDDHPVSREGLAIRIASEPDLEVCGQAADVGEALEVVARTCPDLVVIDISLKDSSGLSLIEQLKMHPDPPRMLVWSMYEDSLYADRALRAGAMGYVNKQAASASMIEAIRRVLSGKVYVSPEISDILLNRIVCRKEGVQGSPLEELSNRELETFQLIGRGMTTKEVARRMKLSPKTVETYRARLKDKLGVETMPELTRYAAQWVLENG